MSPEPKAVVPGRGAKAPADTRRRASSRAALLAPTGAPDLHRCTRSRARGEIRKRRRGLPPRSTVPSSNSIVEGSSVKTNEAGSGVDARGGAGRSSEGAEAPGWSTVQSWQSGAGDRLGLCPEEVGMLAEDRDTKDVEELSEEDLDELLVEEVSIDGMCGVY
jgi:mycofactocin precursor